MMAADEDQICEAVDSIVDDIDVPDLDDLIEEVLLGVSKRQMEDAAADLGVSYDVVLERVREEILQRVLGDRVLR